MQGTNFKSKDNIEYIHRRRYYHRRHSLEYILHKHLKKVGLYFLLTVVSLIGAGIVFWLPDFLTDSVDKARELMGEKERYMRLIEEYRQLKDKNPYGR
ncbi:MAG: hypothetical protein ABIA63_04520 [bacterium]